MSKVTTLFYRGKLIESSHNIKCYIGSVDGKGIFTTNNDNDFIYPRSSIKIFQAIPFVSSNALKVGEVSSVPLSASLAQEALKIARSSSALSIFFKISALNSLSSVLVYVSNGLHNPTNSTTSS